MEMDVTDSDGHHHSETVTELVAKGEETAIVTRRQGRIGRVDHPVALVPKRTTPVFPGIEYLSCMAIAVSVLFQSAYGSLTQNAGQ